MTVFVVGRGAVLPNRAPLWYTRAHLRAGAVTLVHTAVCEWPRLHCARMGIVSVCVVRVCVVRVRTLGGRPRQDKLGQDVFLVGPPGPHRRRLLLAYAQLTGREVEWVTISRGQYLEPAVAQGRPARLPPPPPPYAHTLSPVA